MPLFVVPSGNLKIVSCEGKLRVNRIKYLHSVRMNDYTDIMVHSAVVYMCNSNIMVLLNLYTITFRTNQFLLIHTFGIFTGLSSGSAMAPLHYLKHSFTTMCLNELTVSGQ